ncbi:MAG: hypothetical protein FJW39_00555 [Acidobacteria bacterium]|nr:hypothetical protein [Acidobacteriota bacterium]
MTLRFAATFALLSLLNAQQRPASPAKSHNVMIDNAYVRVVRAMNVPGQKSRMHKHDINRVMVHLDAGTMRLAHEGGKVDDIVFKPGDVRWDPAGGLHTSENIGGTQYHIIEIELKQPGAGTPVAWPGLDPVKTDPAHHKIEFENDQVRVIRQRVGVKETSAMHEHVLPRVTVYLSEQKAYTAVARNRGSAFFNEAGKVSWGERARHSERNTGTEPFEVILVEIKPVR